MAGVPAEFAAYVTSVVAYDLDLRAPGIHRGLPSTSLTLVLPVDQPLDVGWAGAPASRAARWSTVSGLHSAPAAIHHDGTQRGVQLGLSLAGARMLLGVPAAELARELLEVEDVAPALRHLPELLAQTAAPRWEQVVLDVLTTVVRRRPPPRVRPEVGRALALLTRGHGVEETAGDVGFGRRHLGQLVRAECGLRPKELQRVARFERSRAGMAAGRPLAEVAASVGYADQAHLTREWVALAGCTPTTWRREELPFVQDLADPDGRG